MSKSIFSRAACTSFYVSATVFVGCAAPAPRPIGAVIPMEGGRYQSVIKSGDQAQAMKTMTYDAEVTCTKPDGVQRMPWQEKQAPGKYAVISQVVKDKDGKQIKADNKNLEAGIAVGLRYIGLESQDSVEVTTVFKCQ